MANILLFDGTRDPRYGKAVVPALDELRKYRHVTVEPQPGCKYVSRFEFVQELERASYDGRRHRCDVLAFTRAAAQHFDAEGLPTEIEIILMTEQDFFAPGLNSCFGFSMNDTVGRRFIALSAARLSTPEIFTHALTHELGRTYGAASPGRNNTVGLFDSYCANECVMRHTSSVKAMKEHAKLLKARQDKFCGQCADELRG